MARYRFTRDVRCDEWPALPRDFAVGEVIHRYTGCDYGCAADDLRFGGVETVACSLDGGTPFFTVPVSLLEEIDG